jgi:hypothetical protein
MLEYVDGYVKDLNAPKRKINIGETVKIKPLKLVKELLENDIDFPFGFIKDMFKYCGKTAKVLNNEYVIYDGEERQYIELDIDDQMFGWSVEMFEWPFFRTIMENE